MKTLIDRELHIVCEEIKKKKKHLGMSKRTPDMFMLKHVRSNTELFQVAKLLINKAYWNGRKGE